MGELVAEISKLREAVESLSERLVERDARIAELEALLGESRRSSKRQAAPFSKGEPKAEPKTPGRKPGSGHGRHGHRFAPVGPIDREVEVRLAGCCPDCGGELQLCRTADQFQVDLHVMTPVTTRFNIEIGKCVSCNRRVQAHHPDQTSSALGAASSHVGPCAKAFAIWLHYSLGLSFAKSKAVLSRLGVDVTSGAISQAAGSIGDSLEESFEEIVSKLNSSRAITADETGWKVGGRGAWLWDAATKDATAYWVADGRGFSEATQVINPDYSGTLVRDGWAVYKNFENATHQTCIAHLLRRCNELEKDLPSWAVGAPRQAKAILKQALAARRLPKAGRLAAIEDLSERIELLHEDAWAHPECRKLVNHLYNERHALFTFLQKPSVDATNYKAEQAIRPAVVNRKVWGGNRTWKGAKTQGRIMSVVRTATQRGIDPVDYLVRLARSPDPATVSLFA